MITSLHLPFKGTITRKRYRKWYRQIKRCNPNANMDWVTARYEIAFIYQGETNPFKSLGRFNI